MDNSAQSISRRQFIGSTTAFGALASTGAGCATTNLEQISEAESKRIKLGISSYSYWHFREPKVSIETEIEKTAKLGVEAVSYTHHRDNETKANLV